MLSKARSQAVTRTTGGAQGGNSKSAKGRAVLKPVLTPADHTAEFLYAWLSDALRQPPTQLPAAKIFTCRDITSLNSLSAVPREAIYTALIQPQLYMPTENYANVPSTSRNGGNSGGRGRDDGAGPISSSVVASERQLGITANVDDVCLAYQLFDQDPDCANVAEWFTTFKGIHDEADKADGAGHEEEGKKKKKGKPGRKKKDNRGNVEEGGAAPDVDISTNNNKNQELAARFSQATSELQFMGLIKPAKRHARGGEGVVRTMHMPAPLMGE